MNSSSAKIAKIVAFTFLLAIPASAYADKYAIEQWNNLKGPYAASIYNYAKHKSVECERPMGTMRKCSLAEIVGSVSAFDTASSPYVFSSIYYLPTSGNMVLGDHSIFYSEDGVHYRHMRSVACLLGSIVSAEYKAADRQFIVVTQTMKPDDSHCCPSGVTKWRVPLDTGKATYISGNRHGLPDEQSAAPQREPATPPATSVKPVDQIKEAYRALADNKPTNDEAWMSPDFRAAMKKERQCVAKLGDVRFADLFFTGQDYKISSLSIGKLEETPVQQKVLATFKNFGKVQKRIFVFVKMGDQWLLDDVIQEEGSLSELVKTPC
jgi:hypothetical protein